MEFLLKRNEEIGRKWAKMQKNHQKWPTYATLRLNCDSNKIFGLYMLWYFDKAYPNEENIKK